ncbi:MAG: calcium-binding protein, partial [Methyloceanibacter sp.]
VVVTPGTGDYVVTLLKPLLHLSRNGEADDNTENATGNDIQFTMGYTVTDNDGDSATGGLVVTIDDDTPVNFFPENMLALNSGDAQGSAPLDVFGNSGADVPPQVVFINPPASNLLVDVGSVLVKSGGENILLVGYGTDTLTGTKFTAGTTVFTIKLNPSATSEPEDSYTTTFFQRLDDGAGTSFDTFNFEENAARNYHRLDLPNSTTDDMLFSASAANGSQDKVKPSATDIGVADQAIDNNEILRIDFATNVTTAFNANISSYTYVAHYDVLNFAFTVLNLQGNAPNTDVIVRIFNADNNTTTFDYAQLTNDSPILASRIDVTIGLITTSFDPTTLTQVNGGYVLPDLPENAVVAVFATGGFNRIEISNFDSTDDNAGSGGQPFAIGKFAFVRENAGADINMNFTVQQTDADGDSATGTISLGVRPDNATLNGAPAAEALAGKLGVETLLAGDLGDWLSGSLGADTLNGDTGNDTADYRNSNALVTVNLIDGLTEVGGFAQGDTLISIENVIGSNVVASGDSLTGDGGNNLLAGLAGDDTLIGNAGDDTLDGGAGVDNLTGGIGNDVLVGGTGNDTLNGDANNDTLIGGAGTDTLNGGAGDDSYRFGLADGTDTITDSSSIILDEIVIEAGGAALSSLNFERLDGDGDSAMDDLRILYNGQQITVLNHYVGNAVESIEFDGGASFLGYALGSGPYLLSTDNTTPVLDGTGSADVIASSSVGETLNGLGGNDLLFGNGGDDTLNGGLGHDLLVGGAGSNTFDYNAGDNGAANSDVITDFTVGGGGDVLNLHDLLDTFIGITPTTHSNAFTASYLQFSGAASDTLVQVDSNGGGDSFVTLATLTGVLLTESNTTNYVL